MRRRGGLGHSTPVKVWREGGEGGGGSNCCQQLCRVSHRSVVCTCVNQLFSLFAEIPSEWETKWLGKCLHPSHFSTSCSAPPISPPDLELHPSLHLPPPNRFIGKQSHSQPRSQAPSGNETHTPEKACINLYLLKSSTIRMWKLCSLS